MPTVTFEYCALYYLNWWLTRDRNYCKSLEGSDADVKLAALLDAATQYRVVRNLAREFDTKKGIARLHPLLEAIETPARQEFDEPLLIASILRVRDSVSAAYGGNNVLSLTTKFLWLRLKRPIIIYDDNSRNALGTSASDLEGFYTRWREEYAECKSVIRVACSALPGVREFCVDPRVATPAYISRVSSTK